MKTREQIIEGLELVLEDLLLEKRKKELKQFDEVCSSGLCSLLRRHFHLVGLKGSFLILQAIQEIIPEFHPDWFNSKGLDTPLLNSVKRDDPLDNHGFLLNISGMYWWDFDICNLKGINSRIKAVRLLLDHYRH